MSQESRPSALPGPSFTLLEVLIHTAATGFLAAATWTVIPAEYLYVLIGAIAVASLLRLSTLTSGGDLHGAPVARIAAGTLLYGLAWGLAAAAFPAISAAPLPALPVYLLAIVAIGTVASFAGSGLRSTPLLTIALPAAGMPCFWAAAQKDWDSALLWGALLVVAIMLSRAGSTLERLIGRLQFLSQSNTDLVKKLAEARDRALADEQQQKELNESLHNEIQEREVAEHKLKASEQELARILDDMMDTYFHVDTDGNVRKISPAAELALGQSVKECMDRNFIDFFSEPEEHDAFQQAIDEGFGMVQEHEARWKHALGHDIWVSFNAHLHRDKDGNPDGIEGIARDTTESKEAREAVFREKEHWRVTLESIGDGVITTDINGSIQYLNPVAEEKTGWDSEEAKGKTLPETIWLVEEETREHVDLPITEWMVNGNKAGLDHPAILIHRSEDSETVIELTGAPIRDSAGNIVGSVMVFHDVTRLRALAVQLAYQATHDSLTGLMNRMEFDNRVEQAIHSANRGEKIHALFYIDLDQFKIVNDTCGHHAGDELLKTVTRLLGSGLREADSLARLGGDEFGVLLNGCPLDKAEEIAEKLRAAVEDLRFPWEGEVFRIGASIGVVPITNATTGLTELLSAADSACYVAKEGGRNRVHVYHPDDEEVMEQHGQMQWMQRIKQAIEQDHFVLFSQPITSVNDASLLYAELLLRMVEKPGTEHEKIIPPNAFIPAAERYHLMPEVDRWVIRHALRALAAPDCLLGPDAFITINLSGQSLSDLSLYDYVVDELKASGVEAHRVCFEITESAVIANMEIAQKFVTELKKKGCKFALDDFGTGLSTFDYLKNLPVDYVKLDGLLVRELTSNRVSQAMVHAINYVSHVMGMQSIAEFVENDAILERLQKLNVDFAQGYAIAKPVRFYPVPAD